MKLNLMQGDCLELMKEIPDGSVDMILTDPPYGTMKGLNYAVFNNPSKDNGGMKWDIILNTKEMFKECDRVLRKNGACALFAQQPFTTELISNAIPNLPFSYSLTWLKNDFANALLAKKAPVNYTEDICVFFKKYDTLSQHPLRAYSKRIMLFIGKELKEINKDLGHRRAEHFFYVESTQFGLCTQKTYSELMQSYKINLQEWFKPYSELLDINRKFNRKFNLPEGKKYKSNVLEYRKDYTGLHPAQKPVALLEDLICTYTDEGDTVLDFTMGSGTTGVAAKNLNRSFIGIELDENYFNIAKDRIYET